MTPAEWSCGSRLDMALWLIGQHCSVIPLRPKDKTPLAAVLPVEWDDAKKESRRSWKEYQSRTATEDEVRGWFRQYPDLNIGLVCGHVSGLIALDIDGQKGVEWLKAQLKPGQMFNLWQFSRADDHSHFHAFYRLPEDVDIPPSVKKIGPDVDVRGEGSYVVFAPSIHVSGCTYRLWHYESFDGSMQSLVSVPDLKFDVQLERTVVPYTGALETGSDEQFPDVFEGERNSTAASIAGRYLAKNLSRAEVLKILQGWNWQCCKPPLSERELEGIVASMAKTHYHRNDAMLNAGGVEKFVQRVNGIFSMNDLYSYLGLTLTQNREKSEVWRQIEALEAEGVIEPYGDRDGFYRRRETDIMPIDLSAATPDPLKIWMPFELSRYCALYPKNVVVVAGETNAGKTGFLFTLASANAWNWKVSYFTSEMTAQEINARIDLVDPNRTFNWDNVKFYPKADNFADVIDPEGFNIIDYLEKSDNFWTIAADIKAIFEKLTTGVVFISIQKKRGEMFGRGGEFSMEKARLAISLFSHASVQNGMIGSVVVTKCKNFRGGFNPEGAEYFYSLETGGTYSCDWLTGVDGWHPGYWFYGKKEREHVVESIRTKAAALMEKRQKNRDAQPDPVAGRDEMNPNSESEDDGTADIPF